MVAGQHVAFKPVLGPTRTRRPLSAILNNEPIVFVGTVVEVHERTVTFSIEMPIRGVIGGTIEVGKVCWQDCSVGDVWIYAGSGPKTASMRTQLPPKDRVSKDLAEVSVVIPETQPGAVTAIPCPADPIELYLGLPPILFETTSGFR